MGDIARFFFSIFFFNSVVFFLSFSLFYTNRWFLVRSLHTQLLHSYINLFINEKSVCLFLLRTSALKIASQHEVLIISLVDCRLCH